jgi:prepilin-type N-terminal cleavage/methylation domain-containing protein
MKLTPKKQSGFTLIEIVIVLAIAALIMVIVFLAVAGAQRSQRDTAAKEAAARLLAATNQFASNNSGAFPANATQVATLTAANGYNVNVNGATVTFANTNPTAPGTFNVFNQTCTGGQGASVRFFQENGGAQCIGN